MHPTPHVKARPAHPRRAPVAAREISALQLVTDAAPLRCSLRAVASGPQTPQHDTGAAMADDRPPSKPRPGDAVDIEVVGEAYEVSGTVASAFKLSRAEGGGYMVQLEDGTLGHLLRIAPSSQRISIPARSPAQRAACQYLLSLAMSGAHAASIMPPPAQSAGTAVLRGPAGCRRARAVGHLR